MITQKCHIDPLLKSLLPYIKKERRKKQILVYHKSYYQIPENKAHIKAYQKAYCKNPEYRLHKKIHSQYPVYKNRRKIYERSYYQKPENKMRIKIYQQKPERKAYANAYNKTIKRKVSKRDNDYKRRALKNGSKSENASNYIISLLNKKRKICYWCGKPIKKKEVSIDHIIALSIGGAHTEENLVLAHRSCNTSKCDRLPWEFIKHRLVTGQALGKKYLVDDGVAQATLF